MSAEADAAIEIALANDLREIAAAAARIDAFCAGRGISPDTAYAVNLAIEELLANTIAYGYRDEDPHRIEIVLRQEADTLVVAIVDDAAPFDPTRANEPDATASPGEETEDRELGGLGLLLVNRMMDGVEYQRRAGCNVVILTKAARGADPEDGDPPGLTTAQ